MSTSEPTIIVFDMIWAMAAAGVALGGMMVVGYIMSKIMSKAFRQDIEPKQIEPLYKAAFNAAFGDTVPEQDMNVTDASPEKEESHSETKSRVQLMLEELDE